MQLTSIAAVLLLSGAAHAANDLNSVILRTTEQMERELGGRNYDINSSFTEDLHYGDACCIPATNGGKTMCVAAVAEVLIRTLNEVGKEVSEVFVKFPISHWKQSKYLNIRPHLYQFKGVQSRGPGDALSRFGIGEIVPFDRMLGGDVLAFSRLNGSGHAVIFRRYIDANKHTVANYSPQVVGFEYFSAQSSTRGVGRRLAYFGQVGSSRCPAYAPQGADCGIIRASFANAGRLWSPERWTVDASIAALKTRFVRNASRGGAISTDRIKELLDADIAPVYGVDFKE
ncbi:hypothetical protein [Massilia sp. TWP1-3-3]|uniref:hypothetical protein n=1 Tax=Massilia sp. TWP1-3-3 TaxID=2804573 RepID=UPI003CF4B503